MQLCVSCASPSSRASRQHAKFMAWPPQDEAVCVNQQLSIMAVIASIKKVLRQQAIMAEIKCLQKQ